MKADQIPIVIFVVLGLNVLYQVFRHKGVKAALFGASIVRTLGEIDLGSRWTASSVLRVHALRGRDMQGPVVGIELTSKSFASFHIMPIALTASQARELSVFVSQALAEAGG